MKVLSISNPDKSEIKFKISKFPDGQQSISLEIDSIVAEGMYLTDDHVVIESRFNSFKDLELIIGANQALREMGIAVIDLVVPYFLGN